MKWYNVELNLNEAEYFHQELMERNIKHEMSEDCARELALYIENDFELYSRYIVPYIKSLRKKREKGTYDAEKALPGWEKIATEGAKKYERDFLDVRYYYVFNRATREEAARYLQGFFLDQVYDGI